jgi:hypothetical protein
MQVACHTRLLKLHATHNNKFEATSQQYALNHAHAAGRGTHVNTLSTIKQNQACTMRRGPVVFHVNIIATTIYHRREKHGERGEVRHAQAPMSPQRKRTTTKNSIARRLARAQTAEVYAITVSGNKHNNFVIMKQQEPKISRLVANRHTHTERDSGIPHAAFRA